MVRAEGRGLQARGVIEVGGVGVVVPGVADGDWLGDAGAGDNDGIAIDISLGIDELLVGAGDLEPVRR